MTIVPVPQADPGEPVRGVLFDLGGTLLSYAMRAGVANPVGDALRRLGLDPAAPAVRAAREEAFAAVHREYATRRSFLHQDLFRDRVARTAALLGVEATDDVLDRFAEENTAAILEFLLPKPDAAATLSALRGRGLYCAVVSNADDAWLGPSLQRHGLDVLVDDWTSSEEADSCKPDTAIFSYALRKAGLAPGEVLFVGDSMEHDVAGARAAGLRSVLVAAESGVPTPLADGLDRSATPDYEIEHLIEVVGIVDALAGE